MGVFEKFEDKVVGKIAKKDTVRISPDELANMVNDVFIKGASAEELKKVTKTAKGGYCSYSGKWLTSADERYRFHVGSRQNNILFLLGGGMEAYIIDNEENKFYQLEKDRYWKKFYKAVLEKVNEAKKTDNEVKK